MSGTGTMGISGGSLSATSGIYISAGAPGTLSISSPAIVTTGSTYLGY